MKQVFYDLFTYFIHVLFLRGYATFAKVLVAMSTESCGVLAYHMDDRSEFRQFFVYETSAVALVQFHPDTNKESLPSRKPRTLIAEFDSSDITSCLETQIPYALCASW